MLDDRICTGIIDDDIVLDDTFRAGEIDEMFESAPIIGIRRHRLLTDGNGVTTLVAFHGCPLSCKYCINPQCRETDGILQYISPSQLYERVKIDDIYFKSTGGGIVFGGGEPFLYADFISKFCGYCRNNGWRISVETSLNISPANFLKTFSDIDEFIVDIKDMDSDIYKSYTGVDNSDVLKNLKLLKEYGLEKKVLIRIPFIPGYNDSANQNASVVLLSEMGFYRIELFKYTVHKNDLLKKSIPVGKAICEVLKNIRKTIADANGIEYSIEECYHTGICPGTCPKCDKELELLTEELFDKQSQGASINL